MDSMEGKVSSLRKFSSDGDETPICLCRMCDGSDLIKTLLKEGTKRLPDCLNPTSPPSWVDAEKLRRGQAIFHRHFLSIIVSNLVGLLCLLSYESILKALVFTGRSSTARTAFKRYLSTVNHIRRWYSGDIFDPDTSASRSIQLVRRMHARSHTDARNAQAAFPSQTDMVVTQWAFFGLAITHGEKLGIKFTREEEDALVHFWRSIGYLMGIEDRYNLGYGCLEDVRRNCYAMVHQVIVPSLKNPPSGSTSMSESMLNGVHMIVPAVDPSAFDNFTRNLFGLTNDDQNMTFYTRFILNLMIWNFEIGLHLPMIGTFLRHLENSLLIFALYVCNLLPSLGAYYSSCKKYFSAILQGPVKFVVNSVSVVLQRFKIQGS